MPYSPTTLANTFIHRYGHSNSLDHMKLQKLAYYAYGWWLSYNEQPILNEGPEVWKHGPVFDSLYKALRPLGSAIITKPVSPPNGVAHIVPNDDALAIQWIDWIWNRYGSNSGLKLSNMTHELGTPWQTEAAAWGYSVPRNHKIPDDKIKEYFNHLATSLN